MGSHRRKDHFFIHVYVQEALNMFIRTGKLNVHVHVNGMHSLILPGIN